MEILIPVLVLFAIALVCALLLTVSSVLFGVEENEKVAQVRDCLPGANCGACGFSGCDGYAKALGEGEVDNPSLCIPGGDGVAASVAENADITARCAIGLLHDCLPCTLKNLPVLIGSSKVPYGSS